jgi:hypothetical protein
MALKWLDPVPAPDDDEKLRQALDLMEPLIVEVVAERLRRAAEAREEETDGSSVD